MIVIGLTGGIASGKSHVASLLAERGAIVLDADKHAQQVLDEPEVRKQLVARWGASVVGEEGLVIRSEIAKQVFGEHHGAKQERHFLEGIVHPLVRERLQADLASTAEQGGPAAVLDIPLLHESGWAEACDVVLFVDTPQKIRQERAGKRGWEPDELAQREGAQLPINKKRELADHIIRGDSDESASERIKQIWFEVIAK